MKKAIVNDNTIKLATKEICRYEIYIIAFERKNDIRFPIKTKKLIESEFENAVILCEEENHKSFVPIYHTVRLLDLSNANIIKQKDLLKK